VGTLVRRTASPNAIEQCSMNTLQLIYCSSSARTARLPP
jgi:hypothetical protein